MATPDDVAELVDRFRRNHDDYRAPGYNETRVRREFIDPFFEALGWDVNNKQGYAEAYKDVIHEDAIRVSGRHKAPDYCFRVGGARKFFVEAKKPAVDLARDPMPAYQVRRYAWSAKLPLSILTDFEELAVYDCRIQPEAGDKATTARTLLVNYQDYISRWDEIAEVFSRESVLKGSFDQYATSTTRKRGTAEVDSVFLKDLQTWRELLARNIALRNPGISARELNYAVQQILDRIVFLRIAEDREIEEYGRLAGVLKHKDGYGELKRLFQQAEDRYNSGLFHFTVEKGRTSAIDAITLGLTIDDKTLRQIIGSLYYPESPYEFSVISSDILGQVYEQFLGQVIRLNSRGRAVVEEKPEVRKAGGVFYTPTYIVDYIVERTVGRLVEGQTPKQVSLLRFLDPACGSGSFLIAIFQFLLDWHLAYYLKDGPERHARGRPPRVYQTSGGAWRLTADEKKRILLNNVFGVDVDPQAVEVTKLSLLLKVLEGETEETLGAQLALFQERALPDLSNNIKCGNSLVSPQDLYAIQQPSLLGENELYRVNPFDWRTEFPHVFTGADPGFDVVLGNPPYIRIQTMKEWAPVEVEFYKQRYASAQKGNYDIYVVFVERGLELLNSRGLLGYILPHKFFNAQYGEGLRRIIADGRHLTEVVHFGDKQVFAQATTYTALLFLDKAGQDAFSFTSVDDLTTWRLQPGLATAIRLTAERVDSGAWSFRTDQSPMLMQQLQDSWLRLSDVTALFVGVQTNADDVYIVSEVRREGDLVLCTSKATGEEHWFEDDHLKPLLKGSVNIRRYHLDQVNRRLVFPYEMNAGKSNLISAVDYERRFPRTWQYLVANRTRLDDPRKGRAWYGYVYKKNHTRFGSAKLVVPSIAQGSCFASDPDGRYFFVGSGGGGGGGYGIELRPEYASLSLLFLLGVLNSSLLSEYLVATSTPFRGGYIALNKQYIERLPIKVPDLYRGEDRAAHDRIVTLVTSLLRLYEETAAGTAHERSVLQRRRSAIDAQIDQEVAKWYGVQASYGYALSR